MKKHALLTLICLNSSLLTGFQTPPAAAVAKLAPSEPPQPIYVFITADVNDYVNSDKSAERIHRALDVLENYHKSNPELKATFYFSGAMSDALEKNNQTDHLLDALRTGAKDGVIKFGYDGADEPTYKNRSMLDLAKAKNAAERWQIRSESAEKLLTEARDPMTGDPIPGKTGGLKRMQEVFGPAVIIRGVVLQIPNLWGTIDEVGGDPEIVNVIRTMNKDAILLGLPDSDLAHTAGSQFRAWANVFTRDMSPSQQTSPEVWWQEDVLRLSLTSKLDLRVFRATDGVEKLKTFLAGLDRSRPRVIGIELSSERSYLKPPTPVSPRPTQPLGWAWEHVDHPALPEDLCYPASEMANRYSQQDKVVEYLVKDFIPANAGSRVVSASDLKTAAQKSFGYDVSMAELRDSTKTILDEWGTSTTPPLFVKVGQHYNSLADLFALLTNALAAQSRTSHLPSSVHLGSLVGPIRTSQPRPLAQGEVTAGAVGEVCAKLAASLNDDSWATVPHNAIPSPIEIDGHTLTPAQFLRLMAEALLAPSPATELQIKPEEMFAGLLVTFYDRRLKTDLGTPWTFKPASLDFSSMNAK